MEAGADATSPESEAKKRRVSEKTHPEKVQEASEGTRAKKPKGAAKDVGKQGTRAMKVTPKPKAKKRPAKQKPGQAAKKKVSDEVRFSLHLTLPSRPQEYVKKQLHSARCLVVPECLGLH